MKRRKVMLVPVAALLAAACLASSADAFRTKGGRMVGGGGSKDNGSSFTVGSALRYLSKAIFTDALTEGSGDSIDSYLRSSNVQDSSDCVKKLICELRGTQDVRSLDWDEHLVVHAVPNRIDYSSPFVQFQLAADLGQKQPGQCSVVYSRCPFTAKQIMVLMRQGGTSLDIDTNEDYDCTVLFLWHKKLNLPQLEQEGQVGEAGGGEGLQEDDQPAAK